MHFWRIDLSSALIRNWLFSSWCFVRISISFIMSFCKISIFLSSGSMALFLNNLFLASNTLMNNSRYLIFSSVMSIKYLARLFSLALYLTSGSSFSKSTSSSVFWKSPFVSFSSALNSLNVVGETSRLYFVFNSSEFPCCSLTSCSSWWFPLRAALENNVYLNLLGSWWWFSYKSLNSLSSSCFLSSINLYSLCFYDSFIIWIVVC